MKHVAVSKRRRRCLGCFGRIFLAIIIWDLMWIGVLRFYFVSRSHRHLPQSYPFSGEVQKQYEFNWFSDMENGDSDNPVTVVARNSCPDDHGDLFPDMHIRRFELEIRVTSESFVISSGGDMRTQRTYGMGKDVFYLGDNIFMFREIGGNGGNIMIVPAFGFQDKMTYVTMGKDALDIEVFNVTGTVSGFGIFLPFFAETRSRMRLPASSRQDKLSGQSVFISEIEEIPPSIQLNEEDNHE